MKTFWDRLEKLPCPALAIPIVVGVAFVVGGVVLLASVARR
jgi:hypothetical protein